VTGTGLRDRRRRQAAAISTAEVEADTLYAPAAAEAMTVRRELSMGALSRSNMSHADEDSIWGFNCPCTVVACSSYFLAGHPNLYISGQRDV